GINDEKKKKEFREESYYLAFKRFSNILLQIKEYTKSVSKLKGYKKFFQAKDIKKNFEQLTSEFDKCLIDLHFALDVSNEEVRKEESEKVDKALKEVEETLNQIDDKLDGIAQGIDLMKSEMTKKGDFYADRIDSSELGDLETPIFREK
ncbi:13661_t:CDS:2, partial [Ambispora leptoticha]